MPFWLASLLRKRNLCRVKPPEWMNSESLGTVLAEEKKYPNLWQQLPHPYTEIAKMMFTIAEEDFSEFDMDVHEVSALQNPRERFRTRGELTHLHTSSTFSTLPTDS